jgi:hypothetical protein
MAKGRKARAMRPARKSRARAPAEPASESIDDGKRNAAEPAVSGEVSNPVRARARATAATRPAGPEFEAPTAAKNVGGRPSSYSPELAEAICEHIAGGRSLRSFCQAEGAPNKTTVLRCVRDNQQFAQMYALAREVQADMLADECIDIADQAGEVNIARLRIDTRKWTAAKLAPKKYGDKTELGGKVEIEDVTPPEPRLPPKDAIAAWGAKYLQPPRGSTQGGED